LATIRCFIKGQGTETAFRFGFIMGKGVSEILPESRKDTKRPSPMHVVRSKR